MRRILRSLSPGPPERTGPKTPEELATDEALDRLRRAELPTLPEINIYTAAPTEKKADGSPTWLKIIVALGIPAVILEIVRRVLG